MVHYGKHIIDPQTGLCEICDRGAIHDLRRGKRTGKQFLYSNQDGKFTYRPNDDGEQDFDESSPRPARKPARSRLETHHDSMSGPKRIQRRENTPPDDSPRRNARSKVFYEVDDEGQIYPRNRAPPDEPRRRYLVQSQHPLNTRNNNNEHRRARTPPPPRTDAWNARSRRTNNSDSEIVEHYPQASSSHNHHEPKSKAEIYYIEAQPTKPIAQAYKVYDDDRMPPRDEMKRHHQLEPIGKKTYREPVPVVERKVYRKLATNRNSPPSELYSTNGDHLRLTRKVETIYPSPRHYDSTPQLNTTYDRNSRARKYATVYQIQSDHPY